MGRIFVILSIPSSSRVVTVNMNLSFAAVQRFYRVCAARAT